MLSSKSMTKVSKQTLKDIFCFMEAWKSQKQTPHRFHCFRFYSCKTQKPIINLSKNDFNELYKWVFI